MKHLIVFESYQEPILEAAIPVYDEDEFDKNPNAEPEISAKVTQIVSVVEDLLKRVEEGEIEGVTIVADIPSQGKNAPAYIQDVIAAERARMAKRKFAIHGSRIEREDRPEEEDYTDEINIFVDSEFFAEGVERNASGDFVLGIPRSFARKVEMDPSLKEKYMVKIRPQQIIEVTYTTVQ